MKIQQFHVDGFGHFADLPFGPFNSPITVFYGPNEAGKSTLLAFLRTMLFGFPRQHRDQHYPALRGGVHGGRLLLSDDGGIRYEVARTEVNNRTAFEVVTSDGRTSSDDAFLARALGNASKEMFESVFAFSLAELQQFETLSKGDVSAQIYAAGMGAATVPAALKRLEERQASFFKPGGQNQEVAIILRELEGVEVRLREATNATGQYAKLISRRDSIRDDLAEIQELWARLTRRRQDLDRLLQAWDDWVRREELLRRLAELPEFESFPAEAIARVEKLEERLRTANEERAQAERALAQARTAAESVSTDLQILESAAEVQRLVTGQERFAASVQDAPKRQAELASARAQFDKTLQELGPGWDIERLNAFDVSVTVRGTVDSFGRRLEEAESALPTRDVEAARTAKDHEDAVEAFATAQAAFDALPVPAADAEEIERRRGQVRSCRSLLDALLRARDRRDDLQAQAAVEQPLPVATAAAATVWPLAAGLAAGGFLTVILGVFLGGGAAVLGLGVGLALVAGGVGILVFPRGVQAPGQPARVSPTRSLLEAASQSVAKLERDLLQAFAPFGNAHPDAEALNRVEAEIHHAEAFLRDWTAARDRLNEAKSAATRTEQRAADAAGLVAEARERLGAVQAEWNAWLAERKLPASMPPATVKDVFHRVEIARDRLETFNGLQRRLDAIRRDIREYAEPAAALAGRYGIPVDATNPTSVTRATDELIRRFDAARKAEAELEQARQRLEDATSDFEHRAEIAATAAADLTALLTLGSAADPEEFRRNAELHEERETVADQLDSCEQRLRRLAPASDAFDGLLSQLANTDHATLDAECHELTLEMTEIQERRDQLKEESGLVTGEIERLTGEEETSVLRARREVLKGRLEDAAREWSVATLARSLMERARKEYERERQPGVIKYAGGFFQTITGGRYSGLMSPLGSEKLTVADRDGTRKEPGQLSRGTQEALYLSLRFGLIQQFGEQACRLPVIVDEVLVNFDPERACRAAEGFAELAQTNQVLVFTCHPGMVDLFTGACPDAQVINLEDLAPRAAAMNGAPKLTAQLPLA